MWFWRRKASEEGSGSKVVIASAELSKIQRQIDASHWAAARLSIDALTPSAPDNGDLLLLHARVLRQEGKLDEALQVCDRALPLAQDPSRVHWEVAACQMEQSDYPSALETLDVAVSLDPGFGLAWLRLGEILLRMDRVGEAADAAVHAVTECSDDVSRARAHFILGQCRHVQGRTSEALDEYRSSLALRPGLTDVLIATGNAHLMLDQEPQALDAFEAALLTTTSPGRQLLSNLAVARQNMGQLQGARELLEHLVTVNPGDYTLKWYLCQLDLLECRWSAGWTNYHARFGAGASPFRPMPYPQWDGQVRTDSTLLILADQGIGDEIMFASCFDEAIARNRDTLIECEPRLLNLFKRSFPQAKCIATQRETATDWLQGLPQPDWQITSGDLPALFRPDDASFPLRRGYLLAPTERVEHWRAELARRLGPGLKVGVSWRGGTSRTRARARSLAAEHWSEILSVPGVKFVNLQYGSYRDELDELNRLHGDVIHDLPEALTDYEETASLVAALDLVVTVCTAVVHLAGSIGTPVWILTPLVPGWRYTARREELPWYSGTRIFRQHAWGDWEAPCRDLSVQLAELTKHVTS